ncbi:hypothetical protein, variant [Aphanomyces invadans]|uniref:Uncharacterized protein n=1 Tax=Aphanomyces invadans TaxID=157072 RepID=A0A024U4L9_9STRA|nr:hypothetical protein, variant [Aphanomyces invadans]ETW00827.1 hypothetical protein, variant [Aphanomyces invadans]|eukprot:XP_008870962.1 hypothetical protein, variant [Aphanomyces invadans]
MTDTHRMASTRKAFATMPPALYMKYLEATIDTLHSKSEQIFRTLQERDRDVGEATERLAYYQDVEATCRANTLALEEEAAYHKKKWKELDSMRRQDMTGRANLTQQVQALEKQLVASQDVVLQLRQQLNSSQLEQTQLQALATHQRQQIALLEEKANDHDTAIQTALRHHEEALDAQKALTHASETEAMRWQRQWQDEVGKTRDLDNEIAQLKAGHAAFEARLVSAQSVVSEKDRVIQTLVEKTNALGQLLLDVQASQSRMADANADHVKAVERHAQHVQVAQLSRARNQCIEWKARHCDLWHVDRLWSLQRMTWLQWQLHIQSSRRRRLEASQMQWRAKLGHVVAQVREMKLAMAPMQAVVAAATSQPWMPTIAAITMAMEKAMEERNRAQEERSTAVTRVTELCGALEAAETSNVTTMAQLAQSQELEDILSHQLLHTSTQRLAMICYYTWKEVHLRRVVGTWSNTALLATREKQKDRAMSTPETSWHLMHTESHVDFDAVRMPFKLLRRNKVQQA